MRVSHRRFTPWLWGLALASLLFILLACFASPQYIGSDDTPILRSFMGYEGGTPATYHLYLHTALAWLLHGLAMLFPGIAWFSIFQLFMLWFSCVVLVKSAVACASKAGLPRWVGAICGALFLLVYALYISCRITYTTTGALLGAAAVAQLFSVDYRRATDGGIVRGMLLSILLLIGCYCIRQIGVLPPLTFWLLTIVTIYLCEFRHAAPGQQAAPKHRSLKPLLTGVAACTLLLGLLAGVRAIEIKALQLDDYLAWQRARIQLFDYTLFDSQTTPETLQSVGWSDPEFTLVSCWFFLDKNITRQAFETLYAALPQANLTPADRVAAMPALIETFFRANPAWMYGAFLPAALVLLCIVLHRLRKERRPWLWLSAVAGLLLGALLLAYLSYQGRLPLRAGITALLPTAAFLLCIALLSANVSVHAKAPAAKKRLRSLLPALAVMLCLLCAGLSIAQTVHILTSPIDPDLADRATGVLDLEEYALENPDKLIIYDLSLVSDTRLFPNTTQGIPGNTMFWGGYPARSPSWYRQLAAYGVDGHAFTAEDFLRDNVLIATTDGVPSDSLLAYIEYETGQPVDWYYTDEYGYVTFFELFPY